MKKTIALIKGDGIGPEIVTQAVKVLNKIGEKYDHTFCYSRVYLGGESIDRFGSPVTTQGIQQAKQADAVLLGAVGGPKWEQRSSTQRPEAGLLAIRKELNLFANLRPAYLFDSLWSSCPLKATGIENGVDLMVVRELTGGLYFGERKTQCIKGEWVATDTLTYAEHEIRRIAIKAFDIARKRRKQVVSVDKANVLDSSRLWRKIVHQVAANYPDVCCTDMLVDNCAMQLIKNPGQFDVILTENMFGDILSDEASMISGSIGMLASASLNDTKFGLYEPSHGSAPDIALKDVANPLATILSAGMMLRYSFDLEREANQIERGVEKVLKEGYRTKDLMTDQSNDRLVGCNKMGDLVAQAMEECN